METRKWLKMKISLKNATIAVTILNAILALVLVHNIINSAYKQLPPHRSALVKHIKEAEDARLAMLPLDLIKRVKEIEQEGCVEPEVIQQSVTNAVDLSKRLQDLRSLNDASSFKALEEWRKRKMERARQREMAKN